jgi:transposase
MATIGGGAYNFVAPERDQRYLLPSSLSDWLEEDHLAWFVLDCVEEMDLSAFYADYREDGWGRAARHPKTMVGRRPRLRLVPRRSQFPTDRAGLSRRRGFRVICAGLFRDHTTIARFRQRHEDALKSIFTASLRWCAKAGMTSVGIVALDRTKMAANASSSGNRTKQTAHFGDDAVEEMFADAKAPDAAEGAELGDARGDEPPPELRGHPDRCRRFKQAKELLDKELEEERMAHESHLVERAAEEE